VCMAVETARCFGGAGGVWGVFRVSELVLEGRISELAGRGTLD